MHISCRFSVANRCDHEIVSKDLENTHLQFSRISLQSIDLCFFVSQALTDNLSNANNKHSDTYPTKVMNSEIFLWQTVRSKSIRLCA